MNHSTPQMPEKELRYMQATGELPHSLTNDYMFKALLQKNRNVLKELVCSLLHLRPEEVQSVKIKNLDYWAALFKATTWEELKMLAQQSQILKEAVETVYDLTADEAIREQCKAREKHIMEMNTVLKEREIALAKLEQSEQQIEGQSQTIEQQSQIIKQLQQEIERLQEQQ